MILNEISFTEKGRGNDPDDHLENSKDCCSCGAVGIFQGLVVLPGNLADVDNLLRCAGPVLLLHCEVSLLITFQEDLLRVRMKPRMDLNWIGLPCAPC